MHIQGRLHRVNDLKAFIASFVKNGGRPTAGFAPWAKARVHLATDFPNGEFSGGFLPNMSFKADTNGQGIFKFEVGEAFAKARGRIVAYRVSETESPFPGLPPIPVLDPVYRSQSFKVSEAVEASNNDFAHIQDIFVFLAKTPDASGVSQEELDAEIGALRKSQKLDKLRATIGTRRISVTAEKDGGDLKFSAFVRGSTSHDLERVIEVKAGEIDIDLPGPDFIVGLCVDEDEIESSIRKGLSKMSAQVSKTLLNELDKAFPGVASKASVSVWRTRHVHTGTKTVKFPKFPGLPQQPDLHVPQYSVVPDGALGVPKKLY
jgi:hypothetical protein